MICLSKGDKSENGERNAARDSIEKEGTIQGGQFSVGKYTNEFNDEFK